MQLRVLLLVSAFSLSATGLFAQKQQGFVLPTPTKMIKTDTVVISKPVVKGKSAVLATADIKPAYKSVPLAGEKSYYGGMNEYVMEFVRKYFHSNTKTLNVVQNKGNKNVFATMDNILQKHNIPTELKYLAVIESALNNNAVSHAGAVGPWQFMSSTARLMGLTVNGKRDERKDISKSTNAAAKYLSYLYGELNDWLLVVAAYNSGPTPIQRAIARTGSNNFWDIKKYLPRETQGHVLKFIATATIFENLGNFISTGSIPADFSFTKEIASVAGVADKKPAKPAFSEDELKNMAIVRISEPLSFDLMVQELKMDKYMLDKWNPDYELFLFDSYPTEYYSLRIPKDKLDNFIEKKEFLQKRSKQIFAEISM